MWQPLTIIWNYLITRNGFFFQMIAKHGSFLHNQYTTTASGKTFHASWWFRGKSPIIPSSHLNDHIWMVSTLHSGYLKNNRIRQYNLCYMSFSANWMSKKDWFIYPDPKYDIILPWNCHAYWPHQTYTYRSYNHACFSDFFRCNLEGFLFWAKVLDTSFPQIKTGLKRGWRYQQKSNKGRELWFFSSPPQQQNTGGKTFSHIGISLLSMKQGGFVVRFVRCCLSWASKPASAKVQIHLPLALVSPGTKTGVRMDWVTHHKTREKSNNKMSTDSKKPSPHSPKIFWRWAKWIVWTQSFPMDSAKQWQFESLYLPNPKIIIANFLNPCFFAYFCCCFEWWDLTAHLDKLPKNMLLSCAPISSISSIAQKTCHQPRTSRMVSNKGVRSWTEAPPKSGLRIRQKSGGWISAGWISGDFLGDRFCK